MTTSTDASGGAASVGSHPTDETIGAYLDGRLDGEARARFEAHAAGCETCVELLALSFSPSGEAGAVRSLDAARPRTAIPRRALAVAAALIAGVALVVPFRGRFRSPLAPLVDATRDTRPVEARLSGGFLAAPLAEIERGTPAPSTASWRVIAAAEEVRKSAEGRPGKEASHLEGIALLSTGHVDEAIRALEAARAGTAGATDAALLADLSAAYLEKSRRESDAAAAARALELSLAALAASPRSPEALFNRALATERLGLRAEAVARYDEFLAVEPAGGWADEARRRRTALAGAARDGARSPPRRIEREALPALAAAALSEPRDERGVAALLDRIERDAGADQALLVTARRIAGGGPAGLIVARGVDAVTRAAALESRGLRREAGEAHGDAERLLEPTGDPFRLRARLGRLIAAYHSRGFAVDPAEFESLARAADDAAWPTLSARAWWMAGLVHAGRDAPETALDRYETARREAVSAGEPFLVAAIDGLMAEVQRLLGNERAAWDRRALAFLSLDAGLPPVRAHSLLFEASQAAEAAGLPRLALDLLAADAPRARATDQGAIAEDEIVAARAANVPGPVPPAWNRAETAVALVPDVAQRSRLTSELLAARALSAAPGASSLADLDRAIDYFVATDAAFRLPELLLARASARREAGLAKGSAEDAERALSLLEKELAEGGPRSLRVLSRSGALVEKGLDLAGLAGDLVERIERIDAFRGNDLRRTRGDGRGAGGIRQLLTTLDPETAILWLRVGESRSEALLLRREGATRAEVPMGAAGLDAEVRAFREALLGDDDRRALGLAARLHALLLGSVPPSTRRLFVVPDGPLWRLPFSALRAAPGRPPAGVELALSLAVCAPYPRADVPAGGVSAVLADPKTEGTGLPRLPGAAREAARIASLHRGARLLTGDDATAAAFRELAPVASLLHVGAHAVPEAGTGGRLLLAGSGGSLSAARVAALDLRGLRVAVLAGCDTAAGEVVSGEGTISLARAFLAAGARAAVGSSWAVPDGGAEDLLVSLHEGLAGGLPPAEALRRARAAALARPAAAARVWAAFEVYE